MGCVRWKFNSSYPDKVKNQKEIIDNTANFVRAKFEGEGSGHDWWHIWRVWQLAKRIGKEEKTNSLVVELAALLHDIADWKFNNNDIHAGGKATEKWLSGQGLDKPTIDQIVEIVNNVSFKGSGVKDNMKTLEGKVVQDADRLDAMGAMGIARVFAYGGYKGRTMYDPETSIHMANSFEAYKSGGQTSINHFYEKLLLLKDRMNTKTGKRLAKGRDLFMRVYLKNFYNEWKGKK